MAQFHSADAGYFAAIRAPIVRGRAVRRARRRRVDAGGDRERDARPATRGLNDDPIGKRITNDDPKHRPARQSNRPGRRHQVVGVVRDIRNTSLRDDTEPAMYFATGQFPARKMYLVVRGRGDVAQLTAIIREEVRHLDPTLPLGDVQPMSRVLAAVVDPPRFVMMLDERFRDASRSRWRRSGVYGC